MRESEIEKYFVQEVEKVGALQYKFKSPGRVGVPDRIVMFNESFCFVELKATGKEPDDHQIREHKRIEDQGIPVFVIDSKECVDEFIATYW
jgi:hypothetical protein